MTAKVLPAMEAESSAPPRRPRRQHKLAPRERLYNFIKTQPLKDISQEEVDAHFESMPERYWGLVSKSELIWSLETIHAFFIKLATSDLPTPPVVANWRHYPDRGFTKVMICTWDRPGLLAKVAAAFTALRINILQTDAYTRTDNLVLDIFEVSDTEPGRMPDAARLSHLTFLLEGALSEPPRFVSLWASQFHRVVERAAGMIPHVECDNSCSSQYTVVRVEASDRLGLLCDLLQSLTDLELNIAQAVVATDRDVARDVFYVTDLAGKKIQNPALMAKIENNLARAILA